MKTLIKSFFDLTVEDLMSRDVVTVPRDVSLRVAARLLSHSQITGAPVVDEEGRLVGALSASDFVRWTEREPLADDKEDESRQPCVCSDWQVIDVEQLPLDAVCRHMTCDPVTVAPDTPIRELARMMLDAHIHRLFVVNEERHPIGVVTTTDILAALARSYGES